MSASATQNPPTPARPAGPDPAELAQVVSSFNDLVTRLQTTHESLKGEVARLQGELREANRRLRRSQELAALGEMAAGIAHEVRNPLGSIRLYAAVLEEDLADRPALAETARKIGRAVVGLDRIVCDVLDFSREIRIRPEPADARDLLESAVEACIGVMRPAGVEAVIDAPEALEIACDRSLLQRALVNLVRNAAEAIESVRRPGVERVVRLTARSAEIRTAGAGRVPGVSLAIADTGPGLSDEALERMFNPFFTTREAGTGLGLAIVHRIVDAHNGSVQVRNRPEGGALVELLLPAIDTSDTAPGRTPGANAKAGR